jgi:hypothetical protein
MLSRLRTDSSSLGNAQRLVPTQPSSAANGAAQVQWSVTPDAAQAPMIERKKKKRPLWVASRVIIKCRMRSPMDRSKLISMNESTKLTTVIMHPFMASLYIRCKTIVPVLHYHVQGQLYTTTMTRLTALLGVRKDSSASYVGGAP